MSFSNISDSTWGRNAKETSYGVKKRSIIQEFSHLAKRFLQLKQELSFKYKNLFQLQQNEDAQTTKSIPVLMLTQLCFVLSPPPQVLTWSQVTTSCTSTRVRTLMGRYWRVCKATRPQSESRAAGTVSSWRSDRTPHWACLALLSNIEVTQPPKTVVFFSPLAYLRQRGDGAMQQLAPPSHSKSKSSSSPGRCTLAWTSSSILPGLPLSLQQHAPNGCLGALNSTKTWLWAWKNVALPPD